MSTRKYDSTLRADQAALTRERILDAAYELLVDGGYASMTNGALANAAGVSPQTIYNAVGNKAAVLKAVYDRTLAGDDDEIPMAERPEFLAMQEAVSAEALLRAYAHLARALNERVGPILAVLHSSTFDDAVRRLAVSIDAERLTGNTRVIAHLDDRFGLAAHLDPDHARDILWVLTAPDPWHRLVDQRSWSPDDYETWLAAALVKNLA